MCGWPPAHRTTVSPSSPRRRRSRSEAGTRNRGLIALRYGADLTAKQIAEVLGVKTNAVEVALHRALGRLKVLLDPSHPDGSALRPKATESQALDS